MKHNLTVLACIVLLTGCVTRHSSAPIPDQHFVDVAANPDAFDGQTISVTAWVTLRHEDRNLWATKKDHEDWNTRKCISLLNGDLLENLKEPLDGQYVRVTGILRSDASKNGTVIRLGACRKAGLEISTPSSVTAVPSPH